MLLLWHTKLFNEGRRLFLYHSSEISLCLNVDNPANVMYHEVDLPIEFPVHLRHFIPTVYYSLPDDAEAAFTRFSCFPDIFIWSHL